MHSVEDLGDDAGSHRSAKKKIGIAEYLRTFDRLSLKKIAERMGEGTIIEIEYHLDCYLIHSENKKIIITSGQIT